MSRCKLCSYIQPTLLWIPPPITTHNGRSTFRSGVETATISTSFHFFVGEGHRTGWRSILCVRSVTPTSCVVWIALSLFISTNTTGRGCVCLAITLFYATKRCHKGILIEMEYEESLGNLDSQAKNLKKTELAQRAVDIAQKQIMA